ncbi:putative transcription factor NAM family [Helianthus annuus]|nr:putative transcription factor NAM family [Helianthus annuus]
MARSSLIPGFRFHPTDVELVMFYLKRKLLGKKITVNAVAEVNIYDFSPWDLPDKSCLKSGDLEYFFFCPKAKKYSSGGRSNRATESGFWKATGKDRTVKYNDRTVATIKTLVFHIGHKGKGERTDWVMHEYKMEDEHLANAGVVQDSYVLCKVFKKSGSGPKNGAQYGAPFNEEEWDDDLNGCATSQGVVCPVGASNAMDTEHEGPDTVNLTEPGSSNNEQEGPATMNLTEQGSSIVTLAANPPTDTLNMSAAQGLPVTVPGSTIGPLSVTDANFDLPDFMFFEDLDAIMGSEDYEAAANVENAVSNQDDIYTDLVNLVDLDDLNEINFKTDGADYMLDNLLALDDLDEFFAE